MKSSKFLLRCLIASGALLGSTTALAATGVQKQAAIDNGLAWLAAQQSPSGGWCQTGYCDADTASALLAFIEQKTKPAGWNGQDYTTVVAKGLQFVLDRATVMPVGLRSDSNNADQNFNQKGLLWGDNESTYVTGLVLPALSRAVTAGFKGVDDIVSSPNVAVNGLKWKTVIQDTVDSFLQGQTTANNALNPGYRGGWRYTPSTGDSDGSTAQWPAIGMTFAQTVPGVLVPNYTKQELSYWIDYIQSSLNGGSGYNHPSGGGAPQSESKTGGLLVEMAFSGYYGSGGITDTGGLSNDAGALAYLNANWQDPPGGWTGNMGHPYAMWSVYKGLESTIGLHDTTTITNLMGCGPLDPGVNCNWWEDYSQYLVTTQAGDGSWSGYWAYWPQDLATAWYVNILNGTQVGPGPDLPEPATLALLGLGGLLVGGIRRRVPV